METIKEKITKIIDENFQAKVNAFIKLAQETFEKAQKEMQQHGYLLGNVSHGHWHQIHFHDPSCEGRLISYNWRDARKYLPTHFKHFNDLLFIIEEVDLKEQLDGISLNLR